jgi:hypothetical protein
MYPTSKSLDKKVYAIINKHYRVAKTKRILRTIAKAAVIVFAIMGVCFGALMAVDASRNFILSYFIEIRDDYVIFDFGGGNVPVTEDGTIVLGYVPEGFELISYQLLTMSHTYIYSNDQGRNIIIQHFFNHNLTVLVDNEDIAFKEILLSVGTAYLFETFEDDEYSKIIWPIGENVINISSNIDAETLVRIAENIVAKHTR